MPQSKGRAQLAATYASILVHAEPSGRSTHRVEAAARLARDFSARLIGLGAETFEVVSTMNPYGGTMVSDWMAAAQEQVAVDLKAAETAFHRDAAGADVEWRQVQDFPDKAIARSARAADLIVASPRSRTGGDYAADPADIVMAAGRPVLIVPEGAAHLNARNIVIAWKDTREARRAVADAMPLLVRAEDVVVQAVCEDDLEAALFQVEDVAAALARHGVRARASVTKAPREGVTHELLRISDLGGQALVVAGAYGHARLAEWALGGVTDDLMHGCRAFVLLSH